MKIVFPHIPKCAGSSIKSQIEDRADVFFDYHNHPTWVDEAEKIAGQKKQFDLKEKLQTLRDWLVFGHFSATDYDGIPYDLKILLLRDPLERAISHYHYILQNLPDNETTRRRHTEVSLIKDGKMSLEEFVELEHIRYFYSEYYLKGVAVDSRLLVVSIHSFPNSCKAIADASQIKLDPGISLNKSSYHAKYTHLAGNFSRDTELYLKLLGR